MRAPFALVRLLLVAVTWWSCPSCDRGAVPLAPNSQPGLTRYVEWHLERSPTVKASDPQAGGRAPQDRCLLGWKYQVQQRLPAGQLQILLTLERLAGAARQDGYEPFLDSDDRAATSGPATTLAAATGRTVELRVNPDGVVQLASLQPIREALPSAGNQDATIEMMAAVLADEVQSFLWAQFFALHAYQRLHVGDRWVRTLPDRYGPVDFAYQVEFIGPEDDQDPASRRIVDVEYEAERGQGPTLTQDDVQVTPVNLNYRGKASFDAGSQVMIYAQHSGLLRFRTTRQRAGKPVDEVVDISTKQRVTVMTLEQRDENRARLQTRRERAANRQEPP